MKATGFIPVYNRYGVFCENTTLYKYIYIIYN